MAEYLHELRPPRTTLDALVEVLGALDNMGFENPESRAMQAQLLLRQRGYQVLPAIPGHPERAIR